MSNEHDQDDQNHPGDEQPSMPAWVPQQRGPEPEDTGNDADDHGSDGAGASEFAQKPDDSATQSFPPLGPIGPPPGSGAKAPVDPPAPARPAWAPETSEAPSPSAPKQAPSPEPPAATPPAAQPPAATPPAAASPPAAQPPSATPPPAQQAPRDQFPASGPNPAAGQQRPAQQPPAQQPQRPAQQPPAQQQQRPAQQPPAQQQQRPAQQPQRPAQQPQRPAQQQQRPAQQPPAGQQYQAPHQARPAQQQPPPQQRPPQQPPAQYPGQQPPAGQQYPGRQAQPYQAAHQAPPGQRPAGGQYQAPPQAGYPGQGFGPSSGSVPAVGSPPPARKRSKVGPLLGVAAALGLIGGGLAFVTTRDSGEEVEATSSTTTSIDGESTDSPDGTDDSTPDTETGPLGAEELSRSVVQIQLLLENQPTCTGSGTIIDDQGTVVTNFHVVEQSPICPHDTIGVAISETSQSIPTLTYQADLLAFDTDLDLAVIRIARDLQGTATTDTFTPLEVGDSDLVGLGDELRVIGYPGIGGETVTFTTGSVSGFAETPEGGERSWIKTDATITGGNSGGLAADEEGRFVGIPTRVGTGDGEIVDCRVIADSNGDGRLDNADSCVPIGGFINGIRPVALALPLIEEAATASPIDQGAPSRDEPMSMVIAEAFNPVWTSTVTADGTATDVLIAGQSGQPEICLTWDFANVPTGTPGDAIWLIDGETIPEASVFDRPNEGEDSGSFFACISSTNGLADGVYELAWLVDGELVFTEGILVGSGQSILIDIVNDHDVPLCVVQFNPNGTATYGLNELSEPLQPGDFITIEVGAGSQDARVLDCDGDVRLEDNSGTDVLEDSTLTIE